MVPPPRDQKYVEYNRFIDLWSTTYVDDHFFMVRPLKAALQKKAPQQVRPDRRLDPRLLAPLSGRESSPEQTTGREGNDGRAKNSFPGEFHPQGQNAVPKKKAQIDGEERKCPESKEKGGHAKNHVSSRWTWGGWILASQ